MAANIVGDYFVRAAYLDAASAVAFGQLAYELEVYGAPNRLVERCANARAAEIRHARSLGRLAEAYGARPVTPPTSMTPARSLVDIALDNIVEGCVRQTFGAAAARVRARSATDPRIQRAMEGISRDESAHAALAFDIAMWLQAEIDPVEGAWVEDAMRHAVVALTDELSVDVDDVLCTRVGLPSRADALAMWSRLSKLIWHGFSERVWNVAA
jgi:hypothetical protein